MCAVARLVLCLLGLMPTGLAASAQSYPTKPIRMVVPFPPGGPTDVIARLYAVKLADALGQPVVIDNKAGASGQIGTQEVARAAPDGHTLVANPSSVVIIPHVYASPLFDVERDFVAVSLMASVPAVLIVPASTPAATVAELVAGFKAKGGRINFGSSSVAGAMHLIGESFAQLNGLDMQHIAYKGGGPAIAAVISGEVPMSFESLPAAMPQIKGGQLKALALSAPKRSPALPEVPTMIEAGFAGFDLGSWYGIWAPAKTPPEIVKRMNDEINAALKSPEVAAKLAGQGIEVRTGTPQAAQAFIEGQIDVWAKVVRDNGIKAE